MMTILYVASKYDYGNREQGLSFEHYNFYDTFDNLQCDIIYFDFMSLYHELGKAKMNRRLAEIVRTEQPDMLFCVLAGEQLDRATMRQISDETETLTLNWFCDDHWRFDSFTRHWAPCFNW